jgi:hypothetical protein
VLLSFKGSFILLCVSCYRRLWDLLLLDVAFVFIGAISVFFCSSSIVNDVSVYYLSLLFVK